MTSTKHVTLLLGESQTPGRAGINMRKALYGMPDADFQALLEAQDRRCLICGRTKEEAKQKNRELSLDHDHRTDRVRGLLCNYCNVNLGWYERFKEAVDAYLTLEGAIG